MAYSIDYINTICTDLGGSGGHEYEIDGLNEICTLLSATAGHTYSIDALNAICTAMGYTAGWRYEIEALNAICTGGGGTGGHQYEIHAWQEIQTGSLLNLLPSLKAKLLFYGWYSEIADGKMPNKLTGATDYLTVSGSTGSETYQCPNTAAYIAADTDYIWFKTDASQRTTTTAELIGYDLQRTPVKYDDTSPYQIRMIAILKGGETLTSAERDNLFKVFCLPVLWDNSLNNYGHLKDNRVSQNLWTPEFVRCAEYNTVYNAMTNKPTSADETIQNTLVKTLVDNNIFATAELFDLFAVHAESESLINWAMPGTRNPVKNGQPIWEQYGGYKGSNDLNRWINTGFIPNTHATKLNKDSITAFIGVSSADPNLASNAPDFGAIETYVFFLNPRQTNNKFAFGANDNSNSVNNTTEIAHFGVVRNDALKEVGWINKNSYNGDRASQTLGGKELVVCGHNLNGTKIGNKRQIRYLWVGSGLTPTQVGILIDAMEAYLTNYSKQLI